MLICSELFLLFISKTPREKGYGRQGLPCWPGPAFLIEGPGGAGPTRLVLDPEDIDTATDVTGNLAVAGAHTPANGRDRSEEGFKGEVTFELRFETWEFAG